MSFKLLTALSLAAVALAAPRAADSLTISVVPLADSFKSSDVKLNATVSNPTDEDIKILRFESVLDDLPTYSFSASKDGKDIGFRGIHVTPDLTKEESFVTIPAGGSVSVVHSLGSNYDFSTHGTGKYSFAAHKSRLQTSDYQLIEVKVDAVEVDITDAEGTFGTETTTPTCGDQGQKDLLATMLAEARALAGGAASDINSHPNSQQFADFFNNNDRGAAIWQFDTIAGDLDQAGTRILSCTDNGYCASNPGVAAWTDLVWTVPDEVIIRSDIYVCGGWTQWPETHSGICSGQANIRGHIILHEMSHAVAKTGDLGYGCDLTKTLSDYDKFHNADNFACFGSQIHHDYNC